MAKETTKKSTKTTKKASSKAAAAKTIHKKTAVKTTAVSTAEAKATDAPAIAKRDEAAEKSTPLKLVSKATAKRTSSAQKAVGPSSKLKKWNYWLAALYAAQSIAIVTIGNKTAVPVTVQYPSVDTLGSEAAGHQLIGGAFRQVWSLEIGWAVAVFLIVFATIRFMAGRKTRVQDQPGTDRGISTLRWMGFGLGGGLVIATIALLSGITNLGALLLLFASVVGGCVLALAAEVVIDRNKGMWTRFARLLGNLSIMAITLPWIVFALGVLGSLFWNGNLPVYVYSIYGCVALLFLGTILATYFYFARQGRWADPLYAERSFMIVEFLTASFLAWQVYAGLLRG